MSRPRLFLFSLLLSWLFVFLAPANGDIVFDLSHTQNSTEHFFGLRTSYNGRFLAQGSLGKAQVFYCPGPSPTSCTLIYSRTAVLPTVHVADPLVFIAFSTDDENKKKALVLKCTPTSCATFDEIPQVYGTSVLMAGNATLFAFTELTQKNRVTYGYCNNSKCHINKKINADAAIVAIDVHADRIAISLANDKVRLYTGCPHSCSLMTTVNTEAFVVRLSGSLMATMDPSWSYNHGAVRVFHCEEGFSCISIANIAGPVSPFSFLVDPMTFMGPNVLAVSFRDEDFQNTKVFLFNCFPLFGCSWKATIESPDSPSSSFGYYALSGTDNALAISDPLERKIYIYSFISGCGYNQYDHATYEFTPYDTYGYGTCFPGYKSNVTYAIRYCNGTTGEWSAKPFPRCLTTKCDPEEYLGFSWPETIALKIVTKLCPAPQVGIVRRQCLENGTWGTVNFYCDPPSG